MSLRSISREISDERDSWVMMNERRARVIILSIILSLTAFQPVFGNELSIGEVNALNSGYSSASGDKAMSENSAVTRGEGIQLRDSAVDGRIIRRLNSGIRVTIEESFKAKDGIKWYKVSANSLSFNGYVRSDFIAKDGIAATDIAPGSAFPLRFDEVKVKDRPGRRANTLCTLPSGTVCTVKSVSFDEVEGYYWFKVGFEPVNDISSGYIRFDYLNLSDFTDNLKKLGFPDSYAEPLNTIHGLYPEWTFEAYDPAPDMTFDKCVDAETEISVMSYGTGIASVFEAFRGNELFTGGIRTTGVETVLNGALKGKHTVEIQNGREVSLYWSKAPREKVAYYMDPRNFMVTDKGELNPSFFMFLSGTDTEGTGEAGVAAILSTTSMKGDIPGEGVTYSSCVYNKSLDKGVNPYLVAARMRQEHGNPAGDDLINGKFDGYENYYNYFNIQANGDNPVLNGLKYAKEQGWDTRVKSISGGLEHLADNYFLSSLHKQDTLYKQRFFFKDGTYYHHYMTSLYAPHNEAKHVNEGYKADKENASKGVFLIPVYKEMPSSPCPG